MDTATYCIAIQDAASNLLETYGMASTERIAAAAKANADDVRCVMMDLLRKGVVAHSGGLQVWVLANG